MVPEVKVTVVPETVAVNEAIIGLGVPPEGVVPPPVTATPESQATVGRVPCVVMFFLFGLFPSRGLSPAKKFAR